MILRNATRNIMYRIVIWLIIFSVILSGMPAFQANAASEVNQFVYDFRDFEFEGREETTPWNTRSAQEGWRLPAGSLPTDRPVLGFQAGYGVNIGSTEVGQTRSFELDVPESGNYHIQLRALKATNGGIAQLQMDGTVIGTYDFYTDDPRYVVESLRIMSLEQGTHTLTLKVIGRHPDSREGTAGHRMMPSRLILDRMEALPAIHDIGVDIANSELFIGSKTELSAFGLSQDGLAIDLSQMDITYASDDSSIVEVDAHTGALVAKGVGQTSVTAAVEQDGENVSRSLPVTVKSRAGLAPFEYDFRDFNFPGRDEMTPWNTRPAQDGWSLAGSLPTARPVIGFQPSYGANIASTGIGQNRSFHFDVLESGIYFIQLRALVAANGGIGQLKIDGQPIGTYDFYSDNPGYEVKPIHVMTLEEGTHTLTLEVVGRHPDSREGTAGHRMTPSRLMLHMLEQPPSLTGVALSIDRSELYEGSIAQLQVHGWTDEGVATELFGAQVSYGSDDPGVIQVDEQTGKLRAVGIGSGTVTVSVQSDGNTLTDTLSVEVNQMHSDKSRSTIYTTAKMAAARGNIEQYDWAKEIRDEAVEAADRFLEAGHEFLWYSVPPQTLPRSYAVNQDLGSPVTGKELDAFGSYPWIGDPINDPWKITDPSSGYRFPTNDFESYYLSGLDEHGIFDPDLADDQYLVNELYPEKGETWGVDDGYGWVDEEGNRYTFIAHYVHWFLWYGQGGKGLIENAMISLRDAYLYTGDMKYARAGIILLDRVADIYPSLDISVYDRRVYLNSQGGTGQGKAIGTQWEQWVIDDLMTAYDAFHAVMDDPEVIQFLSEKAEQYRLVNPKASGTAIKRNIEDGIIRQAYPAVQKAQIFSTNGRTASVLAKAAVVMDTLPETKEWLDFASQAGELIQSPSYQMTGGDLLPRLVDNIDRDGFSPTAAPGYLRLWIEQHQDIADTLEGYDLYPVVDLYQNIKFRKLYAQYPLIMIGKYQPQIGDAGSTGNPGFHLKIDEMLNAFDKFDDPIYAQVAYLLNGSSADGLRGGIFAQNPEELTDRILDVIATHGELNLPSTNLAGYGFTALRDGIGTDARNLWMYYGRNTGHGHKDALNIGFHGFGVDLAPDLGYPEYTGGHPKRHQWTNNTISHNTVVVDQGKQHDHWVGTPYHYDGGGKVQLIDVEASHVYPQTERYRRTTAYIQVDDANSYAVDFFRIKGGNDHHFSFHGAEGPVVTEGLNLVEQPTGTYAGPDIEFGEQEPDEPSGAGYMGSGFHFLKNVERDPQPTNVFSVDWDIADTWNQMGDGADPHLRLTMLNAVDEVALADGEPPLNKPGNPESLTYMIAHRSGENLNSQFVSVIEPYDGERFVESIERVTLKVDGQVVDHEEAAAMKIELKNGRVDYIINSLDPQVLYTVDDAFIFQGFFGVYSAEDGEPVYAYLNEGTELSDVLSTETGALTGVVEDFTRELQVENEITIAFDHLSLLDTSLDTLIGSYLYAETDGVRNGSYRIEGIKEREENRVTFDVGDLTFVRSFLDAKHMEAGYVYNISEGARVHIPLAAEQEKITASMILETLGALLNEFASFGDYRSLEMHVTAVAHLEQQGQVDKVQQHMESFNILLDHRRAEEMISEHAYHILKAEVAALLAWPLH